jgi:hypothetical protein
VAAELAKGLAAKLSIVTVGDNFSSDDVRQLARSEGDVGNALELVLNQIIIQARRHAQQLGVAEIETATAWGDTMSSTSRASSCASCAAGARAPWESLRKAGSTATSASTASAAPS